MGDWQATSLLNEIDLLTGFPFKSDEYTEDPSGIKLVRGDNVVQGRLRWDGVKLWPRTGLEACERYLLDDGDVVLAMDRPWIEAGLKFARLTTHDLPALLVQRVARLRGGDSLDQRFLYYLIGSRAFTDHVLAVQTGTAVPHISGKQIQSFEFILPPLDEQRVIASVLGSLDDKIELNRRMNRTLEQMAAAIFKAWFVDFEPVRAKASGAASFPGMPQPVFDALPATFADSEIGPIPEGWEAKRLPDIIEVNPKRTLKKGEPAPHLDMKNMPTQGHAPEAWGERPFGSGMKFINGDTLVARITPCLENGKTAFVDFLEDGLVGWGSTEYIVLRPKPPLPEVYAYCLARTGDFRDFAIQNMTGTSGRQRVPATALDHYPLVRPDETTAIAFGEIVEPLFTLIRSNMDESRSLAEARDALLPKLLSGEVRIESIVIEEALA